MKMIKADYQRVISWLEPSEVQVTNSVVENNATPELESEIMSETIKSEELYAKIKNVTIDEAKTACDKLRKEIAKKLPGSSPEAIEETLFMKLKTAGGQVQGDKADIVLVAVGPYVDKNMPKKLSALKKYKEDPSCAISAEGLERVKANPGSLDMSKIFVRLDENNNPVPIDNTQFYGNPPDPKRKNQNFLKDVPDDLKRDAIFLTSTGLCVQGSGKFDGEPGQIAHITGKINTDENGVITGVQVYKNGWKLDGVIEPTELWDSAYEALGTSPLSVPIENVWDVEKYKMVAVKGRISVATTTRGGEGGAMIGITDIGLDEDVVGFADEKDENMKVLVDDIQKGMEAILFGTVNKYKAKDGSEKKNLNIIGCLVNPSSSDLASALDKVADIEI